MSESLLLHNFPQWEKLQKDITDDQYNETIWEELVSHHEKLIHDHQSLLKSRRELKELMYKDMDSYLTKHPYLKLYWTRYANMKYTLDGLLPSVAVYKRAILSYPNSLDLWILYINIILTNNLMKEDAMIKVFKDASDKVGYNFLAHEFWDKYLNWVNTKYGSNSLDYIQVLTRVAQIPLHQYARYTEEFRKLSRNFVITDLVPKDDIVQWINSTQLEVDTDLDTYIDSNSSSLMEKYFEPILSSVQTRSQEKWEYENKIQQDFSLKVISRENIATWNEYLDYEENLYQQKKTISKKQEVISLYERALVPTCLSEKIWIKYLRYLIQNEGEEWIIILNFDKACDHFLPMEKKDVRYMYIKYMELKLGNYSGCKKLFYYLIKSLPTDCEIVSRYIDFLLKYTKEEKIDKFITDLVSIARNYNINAKLQQAEKNAKMMVVTEEAIISEDLEALSNVLSIWNIGEMVVAACKYTWLTKQDIKKTRDVLYSFLNTEAIKSSKTYWYFYFKFELTQRNKANLTHVVDALKIHSTLSIYDINFLINEYNDFMMKNIDLTEIEKYQRDIVKNMLETDFESSFHMKHFLKARLLGINRNEEEIIHKRIYRENGHPAAISEARPTLTNPIPVDSNTYEQLEAYMLPKFRNVEKATSSIRYIHESI